MDANKLKTPSPHTGAVIDWRKMRLDQSLSGTPDCAPFLRWAGSKRRLLPVLRSYWSGKYKRYLEPFAGSASLFFALRPPRAVLGDINLELIATYLELKYRPAAVIYELAKFRNDKREYYSLRGTDPGKLRAPVLAARFIYLNRFCFNGLYRTNLDGRFNVPYGGDRSGELPSASRLMQCSRALKNARLMNGDFEPMLSKARRGDFVYMDPPFAVRARRVFREYSPEAFVRSDIMRLRSWMEKLAAAGITFVVSYAQSEEADILREGFSCQTVPVRRNIAGFVEKRSVSEEVIISND